MEKMIDFFIKYKLVVFGIVIIMFVAMIASLCVLIYNQSLHIDRDDIAGVYGMNGKHNTKITFDDTTYDAVLEAIDGMKYDSGKKGTSSSYETYVCIEMVDGTKYRIKYCDTSTVYISDGDARVGSYINKSNSEAMSNIIKILKALEDNHGSGTNSNTDITSSTTSSSTVNSNQTASANSVEQ